ncbi:phospholipase A1-like [Episyrphus balteatus]|uniref:phospholipase A1-like n=1 Tax=Episyrphus balteatus TaxID=286459 RepID=UPI002485C24D|nr:phospholipase A1-like [Episyrphus balteatus]
MIPSFQWEIVKDESYPKGLEEIILPIAFEPFLSEFLRNIDFAYAGDKDRSQFYISFQSLFKKSLFRIAHEVINSHHFGYVLPHRSQFKEILNDFIVEIKETGLLQKWDTDAVYQAKAKGFESELYKDYVHEEVHGPLELHQLQFLWNFLLIGLAVSTVVFLFELVFWEVLKYKLTNAQRVLLQSLYLGDASNFNTSREDCVWKRGNDLYDKCPDPDINLYLYTKLNGTRRQLDIKEGDWLRNNEWDPQKENIILIHGYAGGDNTLPMSVLRDAYLRHGSYNLFVADWGALALPPCYVAAVHNLKTVARCLAESFTFLRNSGMKVDRTTCVGHSLGAHICGLMANYLNFRVERIIGLDPARPLIKPGNSNRLDSGDAKAVHVIHTNAGFYGETGKVGHVDFCVNGGKRQPYCGGTSNANLCSHIWSICYLAQSIYTNQEPHAEPCSRRCPSGLRRISRSQAQYNVRNAIPMGMHTPMSAFGSYCLKDNTTPFCPATEDEVGDPRCCLAEAAEEVTDNNLRLFRRLV